METDVNCDCWGFVLFYRNIFPLYPINLSFVKRVIFHHGSHHDVPGPHVPSYVSYFCVSFFGTGAVKIIFWTHFLMSSSLKLHSPHGSLLCGSQPPLFPVSCVTLHLSWLSWGIPGHFLGIRCREDAARRGLSSWGWRIPYGGSTLHPWDLASAAG